MRNIEKTKQYIEYAGKKLEFLITIRKKELNKFFNDHLDPLCAEYNISNESQFYTDSILQTIATLTDYYFIWVSMVLGCKREKIGNVQYNAFNDRMIINSYNKKNKTKLADIPSYTCKINEEIQNLTGKDVEEISPVHYWSYYFSYALSHVIGDWGKPKTERGGDDLDENILFKGFCYLEPFMANCFNLKGGLKYNIYLSLNNFLKHNAVPVVVPNVQRFKDNSCIYAFFSIENEDAFLLRNSYLKEILLYDFDDFKKELCSINDLKKCSKGIPITHTIFDNVDVDVQNGFVDGKGESLYFFFDRILFIKKRDSLLVDAVYSLELTASKLCNTIKKQMELKI